jgi:hypothetical protein
MLRSKDPLNAALDYDTKRVGLPVKSEPVTEGCKEPDCFDATDPELGGVSNGGHDRVTLARLLKEMGKDVIEPERRDFSVDEKRALVEFLKIEGEGE